MENCIIIIVIALMALTGIYCTVRHFKRGGCCSGGSFRLKRKKLKSVLYQRRFRVEGMHCAKCKNRVEEIVNDIRGVAGRADLKKGELTVLYSEAVEDSLIESKLRRAGYKLEKRDL